MSTVRNPPYLNNYPVLLMFIFTLGLLLMITRNMFINNATVFGDEYLYKELSKYSFDDLSTLITRGAVTFVYPSFLYLKIFHVTFYFQESFFKAAQILNSLFFCLALFPIYGVARIFVQPQVALLIGVCALISPYGSYTSYFTPESMYYFVFWVFVYLFLTLIRRRPSTAGLIGGIIVGLLFLIKPHAFVVLLGVNLVLFTFYFLRGPLELKTKGIVFSVIFLNAGFFLCMFLLRYFLTGELSASIFGAYGILGKNILGLSDWSKAISYLLFVAARHIFFVSVLYSLPIIVVAFRLTTINKDSELCVESTGLCLLAIITFLLLLAMSVKFTVDLGLTGLRTEISRVHGRYYNFIFPLFLIGFYAFFDRVRFSKRSRIGIAFSIVSLVSGLFLIFSSQTFMQGRWLPIYDFPEISWLANLHRNFSLVVVMIAAIVMIYFGFAGMPKSWVFSAFFISYSLLGSTLVFSTQNRASRSMNNLTHSAKAVENLLDSSELDLGVVFSPNGVATAQAFLFPFNGRPFVKVLPPRSVIEARDIPSNVAWMVLLGDYDVKVPYVSSIQGEGFLFSRLKPGLPFVKQGAGYNSSIAPLSARSWAGPANMPLVIVDSLLAGVVGIDSQLQTPPWGIGTYDNNSLLWLGHGKAEGIGGTLWATERQTVQAEFAVEPGPARPDSQRTVEVILENQAGVQRERRHFDQPTTLTFIAELQPGRNDFQFFVLDEATILKQPNGDTRPLLVLLRYVTVKPLSEP